ncbi:uncharacterized protein LOC125749598 [Brienomyrus brachyistius]|uniref:uncharacterized protein LOC125749598 n=1 Tax=Brienomyrus brachyistius TaxID=42636 RepID=UPI0020B1CCD5|nr:uncharacterized protein LOC125749598 [Brienomyrus brachyistius]
MCRQQQHPHFSLLLTWCGLLTVAVVAVAAALVILTMGEKEQNASKIPGMQERHQANAVIAPTGATSTSTTANNESTAATRRPFWHIQLTYDGNSWIQDLQIHDSTTSIFLHNNSVTLNTGGLYYFYALTTLRPCQKKKTNVLLVRNEIPGKKRLPLIEVGIEGTASLSKLISCEKGDSLMLEVNPIECSLWSPHKTYWGLFLLS